MDQRTAEFQLDEAIAHKARIHWFVFAPAVTLLVFGLFLSGDGSGFTSRAIAGIAMLFAIPAFLIAASMKASTKIFITSKRIIVRRGLLRSDKFEIKLDTIDRTNVHQSGLGRLFDFGSVEIVVANGDALAFETLAGPAVFAQEIARAIAVRNND
jgi:uncharacterized membrane protein YdbT with pleckstrin-like domain